MAAVGDSGVSVAVSSLLPISLVSFGVLWGGDAVSSALEVATDDP